MDEAAVGIDTLPDAILADIWVLSGLDVRRLSVVSHRWRRLALSEPRLWRQIRLWAPYEQPYERRDEEAELQRWFAFQLARLQAVGPGVERLVLIRAHRMHSESSGHSLARLFAFLRPTALRRLVVYGSLHADVAAQLPQFTGLTSLTLNSQHQGLPAGISLLTGLRDLDLSENRLPSVPLAIASLTSLRRLVLERNDLITLPPGPYLEGLQVLDLSHNHLHSLPHSLRAATALRMLGLRGSPGQPDLTRQDVSLLASLPMLRTLVWVPGFSTPRGLIEELQSTLRLETAGWHLLEPDLASLFL